MNNRFTYLVFFVFFLVLFFFNFPLISIFNYFEIFLGVPVLYLYIFLAWLFFIIYLMLIDIFKIKDGKS